MARMGVDVLLGAGAGLLLIWLTLLVVLVLARPRGNTLAETLRLLPDLLRTLARLARDPSVPAGVRVRLWLLLAYLASPVDLVPDFIPVLGYGDDAIMVGLVLRSVVRRAGPATLARHWAGTPDGLAAACKLAGIDKCCA